jgi:hypothetical protein
MSIASDTYSSVMQIVAPMLALAFWVITGWFVMYGRRSGVWRRYLGMLLWTANVAVFWTFGAYWRLAIGSVPPGWIVPINFWSSVIYLQAAFSMLFGLVFLHRYTTPPQGSASSSPETGPNDD